tara:strand:- start:1360 stop:1710 length:351 start_codon:yes stop_codon:yes gene_type:complete
MADLRKAAQAVIEAWDNDGSTQTMEDLRAALEQQGEPVALIRDGVLCWHIPNPQHARPAWTAHGTHMLYTAPPQRKPLTIHEVEQILAQHNYEIHGDRARYIVRMTEEAHRIGEKT